MFDIHVLVQGPSGSPYEKGLYRINILLPKQYPLAAPKLTFKTKVFHCNITVTGEPCPNLLYGAEWSPKLNIRSMLNQVLELLLYPKPADSLNTGAGNLYKNSVKGYNEAASAYAVQHANPESERALFEASLRADTTKSTVEESVEPFIWPHNYLVLEGEFTSVDGSVVYDLPRIQLFTDSDGASGAAAPTTTPLPSDSELGKAIMATVFEIDDVEFTPQKIFHMSDERSALYLKASNQAPGQFTVAVVCNNEDEDELEELALVIPDGTAAIKTASPGLSKDQYTILIASDVIMACEMTIVNCVEYRFGPEDSWILCQSSVDSIQAYSAQKFNLYEKSIRKVPVPCMKSLSRMLGNGPVEHLFDPNFLNPDREAWQVLNEETGKVTDIPRPVTEMRFWNCEDQAYESMDSRLDNAPEGEEACMNWYVDVVKHVKSNLGGLNTSLGVATVWSTNLNSKVGELQLQNKWTKTVTSLNPSKNWGFKED
jgi:ubiquitin-protein ligase